MARRAGTTSKRKKVTKKRARRKQGKGSYWLTAALVVLVGLAALVVWQITSPRPRQPAAPAYEESGAGDFTTLVGEVELALYESLRRDPPPHAWGPAM